MRGIACFVAASARARCSTRTAQNHTAILIIIYSPWKAALFIKMTSAFHTALCSSWRCSNRDNAPFSTHCHRRISSGLDRHMHHAAYISECTAGTSSPPAPHVVDKPVPLLPAASHAIESMTAPDGACCVEGMARVSDARCGHQRSTRNTEMRRIRGVPCCLILNFVGCSMNCCARHDSTLVVDSLSRQFYAVSGLAARCGAHAACSVLYAQLLSSCVM